MYDIGNSDIVMSGVTVCRCIYNTSGYFVYAVV